MRNVVKVFSDVHGNWDAYEAAINFVKDEDICVCLGDLIDRGYLSCAIVIDYAKRMRAEREAHPDNPELWRWFFVLGNHEQMLQKWLITNGSRYWDDWIRNGGSTVCREILESERPEEKAFTFLSSFAYLMCNAVSKCYIRKENLYVCSHAGPTDKNTMSMNEGVHQEDVYGRYARRVWSRPLMGRELGDDDRAIEGGLFSEERVRFNKERIALEGRSLLGTGRKKFYVFGHTPQDIGLIGRRWNSRDGIYLFLPIDSGIVEVLVKEKGNVAVGTIGSPAGGHSVQIVPDINGATVDYTTEEYKIRNYPKRALHLIREQWDIVSKEVNLALFNNSIYRVLSMYWGDNRMWERNLTLTGDLRDMRKSYYERQAIREDASPVINIMRTGDVGPLIEYVNMRRNEPARRFGISKETKLAAAEWALAALNGVAHVYEIEENDYYLEAMSDGRLKDAIATCDGGPELLDILKTRDNREIDLFIKTINRTQRRRSFSAGGGGGGGGGGPV